MSLRDRLQAALKDAMKAKQADRLSTLRLINAAIKDRDIASRGDGGPEMVSDADITAIMGRMVKQRQESARAYEEGGRLELAEKELQEIVVIQEFLPRQMTEDRGRGRHCSRHRRDRRRQHPRRGPGDGSAEGPPCRPDGFRRRGRAGEGALRLGALGGWRSAASAAVRSWRSARRSSADRKAPISTTRGPPVRVR
jgi:uncharacterized protein YqeY